MYAYCNNCQDLIFDICDLPGNFLSGDSKCGNAPLGEFPTQTLLHTALHVCLHVKCTLLFDFIQNWNVLIKFSIKKHIKFNGNPFSHSQVVKCVQAGGWKILLGTLQGYRHSYKLNTHFMPDILFRKSYVFQDD
jgi:hypothetical protein